MRQTCARISLDNYRDNIRILRCFLGGGVRLMAVVKADAYGHGIERIAGAAEQAGADWLGVAMAEEGTAVRRAGVRLPILIFTALNEQDVCSALEQGLTLCAYTPEHVASISKAAEKLGRPADVHVKLDTGMNRIGARDEAELGAFLEAAGMAPGVRLTGAFTHFACADSPDPSFSDRQLERFRRLITLLPKGILLHAAGSSALLAREDAHFDMVRAGIALYGYPPVRTSLPLKPVLSWAAEISYVKEIRQGDCVSYGATFQAEGPMKVATVSAGYGDGFSRSLSNRGQMLINGRRCRVLGRVCMDQAMVDVTEAGQVRPGDEAVLIGVQGEERITADDIAAQTGTIPYEVLLNISKRVPRRYESV